MTTPPARADVQNVRVTVRLRPLNKAEKLAGESVGWQYNDATIKEQTISGTKSRHFDRVLGPDSSNSQAYKEIAAHVVSKAIDGFNATVFAYGQTGSGKTWTMMGDNEQSPGIIPQALTQMFAAVSLDENRDFLIRCSFLELYNECVNDLLNTDGTGQNLTIVADDPVKGAIIAGLREEIISSVTQGMELVELGNENRKVASTVMNSRSSRSHTIFRVVLEATTPDPVCLNQTPDDLSLHSSVQDKSRLAFKGFGDSRKQSRGCNTMVSYLNLVDLAGSERQSNTGATGSRLKEGAAINRSLLALGAVINKLSDMKSGSNRKRVEGKNAVSTAIRGRKSPSINHVPYRNSKLTRILKQSLGGNTFTSIVVAMSPAPSYRDESRSSLKFGQMCKSITNTVRRNTVADNKTLVKQYKLQIAKLELQLRSGRNLVDQQIRSQVTLAANENVTRENDALRKKISFLQNMFLGASGIKTGRGMSGPRSLSLDPSKKMRYRADDRGRRGRAMSIAVSQDDLSNFKLQLSLDQDEEPNRCTSRPSLTMQRLEPGEHSAESLPSHFKSNEWTWAKTEKQRQNTLTKLHEVREELAREKGKNFDLSLQLANSENRVSSLAQVSATAASLQNRISEAEKKRDENWLLAQNLSHRLKATEKAHENSLQQLGHKLDYETEKAEEAERTIKNLQYQVMQLDSQLAAGKAAIHTWQTGILGRLNFDNRVTQTAPFERMLADVQLREVRLVSGVQMLRLRQTRLSNSEQQCERLVKELRTWEADLCHREDAVARRLTNTPNRGSGAGVHLVDGTRQFRDHMAQLRLQATQKHHESALQKKSMALREASVLRDENNCIRRNAALQIREDTLEGYQKNTSEIIQKNTAALRIQSFIRNLLRHRSAAKLVCVAEAQYLIGQGQRNTEATSHFSARENTLMRMQRSLQFEMMRNLHCRDVLQSREQANLWWENKISRKDKQLWRGVGCHVSGQLFDNYSSTNESDSARCRALILMSLRDILSQKHRNANAVRRTETLNCTQFCKRYLNFERKEIRNAMKYTRRRRVAAEIDPLGIQAHELQYSKETVWRAYMGSKMYRQSICRVNSSATKLYVPRARSLTNYDHTDESLSQSSIASLQPSVALLERARYSINRMIHSIDQIQSGVI